MYLNNTMKKIQLSYADIELLQFILKNFRVEAPSMTDVVEPLQLKLITMIAQMEYEKRE